MQFAEYKAMCIYNSNVNSYELDHLKMSSSSGQGVYVSRFYEVKKFCMLDNRNAKLTDMYYIQ